MIVGLITARGGSKSIPRKNVQPLGGKPLIAWTIEAALHSPALDRVIVSTDDHEIAQISRDWGAEVPFLRPAALAQDDSDHVSVVMHAIQWLAENLDIHPEYVMLLQPTSPFRSAEDISAAVALARQHEAPAVVSVSEARCHPYLAKRITADGRLADFVTADLAYLRRQDLPPVYALNGAIYLNRPESLVRDRTFLPPGTIPYIMPPERSLDIDSPWDFYLADLILRDRTHAQDDR